MATISQRGAAAAPVDTTTVSESTSALPASLTVPGWKLNADQINRYRRLSANQNAVAPPTPVIADPANAPTPS